MNQILTTDTDQVPWDVALFYSRKKKQIILRKTVFGMFLIDFLYKLKAKINKNKQTTPPPPPKKKRRKKKRKRKEKIFKNEC